MVEKREKLGVVGHPIKHSLSAVMHNAAFRELGLDYEYESFDVDKAALRGFIENCRKDFLGLNVTIPHKVDAIAFLDELSHEAELIGSVNTIKFEPGKAVGYNTDGIGCVRSLAEAKETVKGKQVLVIGAGGAARAVAFQCVIEGARVAVTNRTAKRAEDLVRAVREKLGQEATVIDFTRKDIADMLKETNVLINTTSVGMFPHVDESPIPVDIIPNSVVVLDIVYNPVETRLLREAKARGCRVVNGAGMLVFQGAESLKIWLGVEAPTEAMKEAVLEELKKR